MDTSEFAVADGTAQGSLQLPARGRCAATGSTQRSGQGRPRAEGPLHSAGCRAERPGYNRL